HGYFVGLHYPSLLHLCREQSGARVGLSHSRLLLFIFNDTAPTEIYTLSLHDALPILAHQVLEHRRHHHHRREVQHAVDGDDELQDRKSTRLNSSHVKISYAVFCLKKKKIRT